MGERYYTVGKIVNTHGIKGECKVLPQTDFPEVRFAKGSRLFAFTSEPAIMHVLTLEAARVHKNVYIVKFAELNDINQVLPLKGAELKVPETDRVPLAEDEYYYSDIVDCQVITDEGEELGQITEILTPGANDVWVVRSASGEEILLPVIDDVILDVDPAEKMVRVHLLEGLR